MLARLVGRIEVRAHAVPVEVLRVGRRLARIVQVRDAVPEPVAFPHRDVIHLDGEEAVQAGLPRPAVNVLGDGEEVRPLAGVFDRVQAGLFDRREVELRIGVAQPRRGSGNRPFEHLLVRAVLPRRSTFAVLGASNFGSSSMTATFGKFGRVTGLAVRHHRRPRPVRDHVRVDVPDHRAFGLA